MPNLKSKLTSQFLSTPVLMHGGLICLNFTDPVLISWEVHTYALHWEMYTSHRFLSVRPSLDLNSD